MHGGLSEAEGSPSETRSFFVFPQPRLEAMSHQIIQIVAAAVTAAVNRLCQAVSSPLLLPSLVLSKWVNGSACAPGTFRLFWDRYSRAKMSFGKSSDV
eukprot:5597401-Pyramimonas_sp.AAC.1